METNNQVHINGDGNIVIQDLDGQHIEINHKAPELKKRLQEVGVNVTEVLTELRKLDHLTSGMQSLEAALLALDQKRQRRGLLIGGMWVLLAGLGLLVFYQITTYESGPFDFTVKLAGLEDDNKVLHGEVIIEVGNQVFAQPVERNRRVRFQLDRLYLEGKAAIRFHIPTNDTTLDSLMRHRIQQEQPYEAAWPQDSFLLTEDAVLEMPLRLTGLDEIHGYVYDFLTEKPICGVTIRLDGTEITTNTNEEGTFSLQIPSDQQRKYQNVILEKEGYAPKRLDRFAPHTKAELRVAMDME